MTEDEAKANWCPYSRESVVTMGYNHDTKIVHEFNSGRCIGSTCMAWRWLPLMADEAFKNAVIKAAKDIGDTTENKHKAAKHVTENRALYGLPVEPFDGFCGLAGKP